jgi:hypothetical protein
MSGFVSKLLSNNVLEARNILDERLKELIENKINQIKLRMAAEMFEDCGADVAFEIEDITEGNIMKMGRTKVVRIRIRAGKVQRRKKLSAVPGFTIRGGKMIRMSPMERRHRKMAARRARFKRRAKMKQALRKRRISLRKRGTYGL